MSIKNLLCDIPEEIQDLLYEELDNYTVQIDSLTKQLAEANSALAALQEKYDKKEDENKKLIENANQEIESFSDENDAIHYVRENYEWLTECQDLKLDSELDSELELQEKSMANFFAANPECSTYVDFNGNEHLRMNDFHRWNPPSRDSY